MGDTTGLNVILSPMYESVGERVRPCANIIVTYDNNKVNLDDTVYTYYFDDKPVKSFLDVLNPSTGVHNFKVVVSYKGETKIANADLKYSKYKKFKVGDSNEPTKTKKNKSTKPFISRKRFPYSTAEYGQVYYTNTIKVCNRGEGNREEAQSITNIFYGSISSYVIYNSSTKSTSNYHTLDYIPKDYTILSVILNEKTFIVKYNTIVYSDADSYYPNAAFRTLVEPPKIINAQSLYKYAICRRIKMKAKKGHSSDLSGIPARNPYKRWKRIKPLEDKYRKYKEGIFNMSDLGCLILSIKNRVFKIRTESNSGNFSNWFYYYYNKYNNTFNRIDKYRY